MQYQSLEEETDMKLLEERIQRDGIVREGNVLKVDSFINHQMDIPLFREMAKEWKRLLRPAASALPPWLPASSMFLWCLPKSP